MIYLEEYFVELIDRDDVEITFPVFDKDTFAFSVKGVYLCKYNDSTLSSALRDIANVSDINFNILNNIKNENDTKYNIEYLSEFKDKRFSYYKGFSNKIRFSFEYTFTPKVIIKPIKTKIYKESYLINYDMGEQPIF